MNLLKLVASEDAEKGEMKQFFSLMEKSVGGIPATLKLIANSPGLFRQLTAQIGYYRAHEKMSAELLVFIRYLAAIHYNNTACICFNGDLLKRQGMTDDELSLVVSSPSSAPLEQKEIALLNFVIAGIKDEDSATEEEMDSLRDLGWSDSDVIDAVYHGFFMFVPGKMLNLFKIAVN